MTRRGTIFLLLLALAMGMLARGTATVRACRMSCAPKIELRRHSCCPQRVVAPVASLKAPCCCSIQSSPDRPDHPATITASGKLLAIPSAVAAIPLPTVMTLAPIAPIASTPSVPRGPPLHDASPRGPPSSPRT